MRAWDMVVPEKTDEASATARQAAMQMQVDAHGWEDPYRR